jgi:hypothetical protein
VYDPSLSFFPIKIANLDFSILSSSVLCRMTRIMSMNKAEIEIEGEQARKS